MKKILLWSGVIATFLLVSSCGWGFNQDNSWTGEIDSTRIGQVSPKSIEIEGIRYQVFATIYGRNTFVETIAVNGLDVSITIPLYHIALTEGGYTYTFSYEDISKNFGIDEQVLFVTEPLDPKYSELMDTNLERVLTTVKLPEFSGSPYLIAINLFFDESNTIQLLFQKE
jgi:hypothetical protein